MAVEVTVDCDPHYTPHGSSTKSKSGPYTAGVESSSPSLSTNQINVIPTGGVGCGLYLAESLLAAPRDLSEFRPFNGLVGIRQAMHRGAMAAQGLDSAIAEKTSVVSVPHGG
jgi:hypothetical protein